MKCVEKFLQSVENLNKILTERISMFARLYVGILMKPEYIWENDMLTEIPMNTDDIDEFWEYSEQIQKSFSSYLNISPVLHLWFNI